MEKKKTTTKKSVRKKAIPKSSKITLKTIKKKSVEVVDTPVLPLKEIINLKTVTTSLWFKLIINRPKNGNITVHYGEDYADEVFENYNHYFDHLSHFYRNRIDSVEEQAEKISLCNNFLDIMQGYKLDLRFLAKDTEKFFREVELYKEQFFYYKQRLQEEDKPFYISKKDTEQNKTLTAMQQILLLDYIGVLDLLNDKTSNIQKKKIHIIASLIDKSSENVKKYIANIHKIDPFEKIVLKTENNLQKLVDFFIGLEMPEVVTKIQEELKTINEKTNK